MLETEGYFKLATSNFRLAETHLKDAEAQLHKLMVKLVRCAELVKEIPVDEVGVWDQVDQIMNDSQATDTEEVEPVSS
jgi:hypothetical protein